MELDWVIDVGGLGKRYGDFPAVTEMDLRVGPGRVLGLVGPNGAGKTTSMRCMAGIIPPSEGTIAIGGVDLLDDPIAAKGQLAFVADTPHLFDYLTVEEHLRFRGRIYGVENVDSRIDALLAEFELEDKRGHLPQALSRGMKQKVEICMGFLHEPLAVFLDEPLTGLDPLGIRRMKDAIVRHSREHDAGIVVSSHQLELVEEICDEIYILKDGRRVVSGTIDEIRATLEGLPENHSLEDIFFRLTHDGGKVRGDGDEVSS